MQTTPLAKAITTLEGQLVLASDVVLGACAAISPGVLPPKWAGVIVGVQHVALLLQRALIKIKASPVVSAVVTSPDPLAQVLKDVEAAAGGPPTGA